MKDMISNDMLHEFYSGIDIQCVFSTFKNRQTRLHRKGKILKSKLQLNLHCVWPKPIFCCNVERAEIERQV